MKTEKELMLKFIKKYRKNVVGIEILEISSDYYNVCCDIEVEDVYGGCFDNMIGFQTNCKVNVDEFNKFKKKQNAIIWD